MYQQPCLHMNVIIETTNRSSLPQINECLHSLPCLGVSSGEIVVDERLSVAARVTYRLVVLVRFVGMRNYPGQEEYIRKESR